MKIYTNDGRTLTLRTCTDCDGDGDLSRAPTNREVLDGSYSPADRVYSDCQTCCSAGLVQRCTDCGETFDIDDVDLANFHCDELMIDEDERCWPCSKKWADATSITTMQELTRSLSHNSTGSVR